MILYTKNTKIQYHCVLCTLMQTLIINVNKSEKKIVIIISITVSTLDHQTKKLAYVIGNSKHRVTSHRTVVSPSIAPV